ncbi:MAG: photosynthetic reaction center cytochrome c subunit [Gemmatimonadales bacterium]|nr:MAG: photosynthetic reaction center cytochrome c subunit [Gemmatimonadales bacterium]
MKNRGLSLVLMGGLLAATGCELPPVDTVATGFRGTGMEHVSNPGTVADSMRAIAARIQPASGTAPAAMEPAPPGTWENVQVLGHLSEAEFNRFMLNMTIWVAQGTGQGCNYCHVVDSEGVVDFVSDNIYTKVVSRDMISMTQDLNANWETHVGEAGVNCWTCHQGQALPTNYWFFADERRGALIQNFVNAPRQPERYLLDEEGVRVQSGAALTADVDNPVSTNDTRHAYWVMLQMTEALGVNCTYCHMSPRWGDWEESPPTRTTALRGVRMTRELNQSYMLPLQNAWPAERLGPMGDGPKIQCATCHMGAYIPQYGHPASHGQDHPAITQIGFPHAGSPAPTMEMDPEAPPTGAAPGAATTGAGMR